MLIVQVQIHVKSECVEAFKAASLANAQASIREPGIARFDVLQQQDDPTRFVFVEAYRNADAPAQHKETRHYKVWQETVEPMMAEARSRARFKNLFPEDHSYGMDLPF